MKSWHPLALSALLLLAGCSDDSPTSSEPFPAFSDSFEDGTIDAALWVSGGDVSVVGGLLQLRRDSEGDFIESADVYPGNWKLTLRTRLNSMHWHDMFHGISIRDADGAGVSFGYTAYGKLFRGVHDAQGGTSFDYGPTGSNRPGEWQTWTIEAADGEVSILVDDSPVTGLEPTSLPRAVRISLPGYYQDGDGDAGTGVTSSDIDSIVMEEQP